MKLEDYFVTTVVGVYNKNIDYRCICETITAGKSKKLCSNKLLDYLPIYRLDTYSHDKLSGVKGVPVCKECFKKLPDNVKEEFIFNWSVAKLKG